MSLQLPLTLKLPGGREVAANAKGRTSIDATQARVKAFSFVRYNGGVTLHQLGMRKQAFTFLNQSDLNSTYPYTGATVGVKTYAPGITTWSTKRIGHMAISSQPRKEPLISGQWFRDAKVRKMPNNESHLQPWKSKTCVLICQ